MSQGLIQGSMREAPLPDIIQLVSQGGKTGCFHVMEESRRARIYLKGGRIIHAVTNENQGLDALYQVALWLDGTYHFEEGDAPVPTTITKPNPSILMEMHRRMDEWQVISQKIGSLELYPHTTLLPGETPSGVNPREAKLLAAVTGYYSVEELAALMDRPVLSLAKDLYGLVMAGHVAMKGVRSGKRPDLPGAGRLPHERADEPRLPATVPEPMPVPEGAAEARPEPRAGVQPRATPSPPPAPGRLAKRPHIAHRIIQTAKAVLPPEHHDMLNRLLARANLQLVQGEGPDAVKNLALAVSKGAVDAGCDNELVKTLNSHLKALFAK
jgi:hypothetical protein